jgi:SAM-dependent methyltransferase
VDCGTLDHPYKVLSVLNQSQEMMRKFGFRWCLVGERKFLAVAKTEAEKRLRIEISPILADQIKAHEYLEILPSYNQLREDTIHFITFLPPMLGQTLEMGSGYGQLARVLSPRAKSYICVDLGLKMFKDLKQELGQYGIVADAHYLPFAEETFDTIIADNFLEHLYDPLTCLKEVFRVLRHGGRLYAMIPLDALNAEHSRCAHLWKADEENIHHALEMANLVLVRCEIIDLYEMGVSGAFPACNGLLCKVEAMKSPDGIC